MLASVTCYEHERLPLSAWLASDPLDRPIDRHAPRSACGPRKTGPAGELVSRRKWTQINAIARMAETEAGEEARGVATGS